MIDQFSPFTRRFMALTILALLLIAGVNLLIVPVSERIHASLDHLADLRFERARLDHIQARPAPEAGDPVPEDLYLHAVSAHAAAAQLSNLVASAAQSAGLIIEQSAAVADASNPRLVALDIRLTGAEASMMSFLNAIEANRPLVRLLPWELSATDSAGGPMRLEARAVAAWGQAH